MIPRPTLAASLVAGLCLGFPMAGAAAPARAPMVVKIIALNDYHGSLLAPGTFGTNNLVPEAQRPTVGGAEYIAAHVARLKAQNPLHVVVGAGDFIGASPLISALFLDEPAVETLNHIGVEFNAVGNHEFDKGLNELRRLQDGGCKFVDDSRDQGGCKGLGSRRPGMFDGAWFKWLAANVVEKATGRTPLPAYGIKTFRGVKVAFIGVTLRGTPRMVIPEGVAGLDFRDEADTVNALVPRLRAQGVEAIVLLVHQGGVQASPTVGDINGCDGNLRKADGSDSEIGAIVRRLDDAVDLVISGHTHAAYNCSASTVDVHSVDGVALRTARPTGLPNRVGRLVPVTSASAFGRVVTDIDMTLDRRTHHVLAVLPTNRLVDHDEPGIEAAIQAEPRVRNIVRGYAALVEPLANRAIGTIATALSNLPDDAGQMPAGKLIADAQLRATQPVSLGAAAMAFMNPGGIRAPGFAPFRASYPYDMTYGDAFAVQPFGNSLVTLTLTAQQIKDLLEQQFTGCMGQTAPRILQVSIGLSYSWSASAPACAKVVDVNFVPTDLAVTPPRLSGDLERMVIAGVVQNPTKTYRVTVNNLLAAGGDGFTVLTSGSDASGGPQDIDALTAFLAAYKAPSPAYDPAQPQFAGPRITRLP
jgi:5'-nucleotidase